MNQAKSLALNLFRSNTALQAEVNEDSFRNAPDADKEKLKALIKEQYILIIKLVAKLEVIKIYIMRALYENTPSVDRKDILASVTSSLIALGLEEAEATEYATAEVDGRAPETNGEQEVNGEEEKPEENSTQNGGEMVAEIVAQYLQIREETGLSATARD